MKRLALLTLASLAAMAPMTGVASAKTYTAKSIIQQDNSFCGDFVEGLKEIGIATLKRTGNSVTTVYVLKSGLPDTEYSIELWGGSCEYLGELASFTTNKHGAGKGKGAMSVPAGDTSFFATGVTQGTASDSVAVELP